MLPPASSAPSFFLEIAVVPWWSLCLTPISFNFFIRTETRVIMLKHKQVVSLLYLNPSCDWESHLPQNKSQSLYRTHTVWTAPYLSDLLLIYPLLQSAPHLPLTLCLQRYPSFVLPRVFEFAPPVARHLLHSPPHFLCMLTHLLSEASLTVLSTLGNISYHPPLLSFPPWHFSLFNIVFVLLIYLFIVYLCYPNIRSSMRAETLFCPLLIPQCLQ